MSLGTCLRCLWITLIVSLMLSPLAKAQKADSASAAQAHDPIQPGIVVESVAKYSEGEKAGLQSGDVLLGWTRGDSKGAVDSPFDLFWIEIEQAPLGTVKLEGLRGAEGQTWSLGPSDWGLKTRPHFGGTLLALYSEAQDLAKAGKVMDASARWESLAGQIPASPARWISSWLFFHAADLLREAKQWKQADDEYQAAIRHASGTGAVIEGALLQAWAKAYQERSDWSNAEKYFQQSIAKIESSGGGELAIAASLNAMGRMAELRGDLVKADQYDRRALEMEEKLAPESLDVATSLSNLGNVAWHRGELVRAEQYHRQALAIREKLTPKSLAVASTLNNLGLVAWRQGDLTKAEQYHRQALAIREKLAPGSLDAALSLNNLGIVAADQGDLAQAEQYHRQALAIREKLAPGSLDVAASLNNLGVLAANRGNLAEAEQYSIQVLDIRQKLAPATLLVAGVLNNLGNLALRRGDLTKAEQYHRQALSIEQKLAPASLDVAASLNNLGNLLESRGDLAEAEQYHRQALDIRQKLAPASLDVAASLNNLGNLLESRGDLAEAEQYYRQALDIRQKLAPASLVVAASLDHLGSIAYEQGERAEAEEYFHQALAINEKLAPESLGAAPTIQHLGDSARAAGDLGKAEQYYRQALAIREKLTPDSILHAESLAAVALILRDQQQLDAAGQFYARAVSAFESQTAHLGGSEEVRSGFRASHADIYRGYVELLLAQNKPDQAFEIIERSRARILLEMLVAARVDIRKGADPSLLQQERSLRGLLAAKSDRRLRLLGEKNNEKQLAALTQEIEDLDKQYQEVEERLRLNSPAYAALTQPQALTVPEIQRLLDPEAVLLEYSLGEERSYVFAVTPQSITALELPKRATIEELARRVFDLLQSRKWIKGETDSQRRARWAKADADYAQFAGRLSQMVLAPIAAQLPGKRLVIVSDGALQYIPFAALPVPRLPGSIKAAPAPLVAEHEILNLPSASVLAALRQEWAGRKPAPKTVAVFADPVFSVEDYRVRPAPDGHAQAQMASKRDFTVSSQSFEEKGLTRSAAESGVSLDGIFPRLRFSRREAEAIYSTAGRHGTAESLDFAANKTAATSSSLKDYRILHFATHGLLNNQHADLSGLVFSLVDEKGQQQDGFVRLADIYNLELNADLVVLSACQTALGKQIEGEGLLGVARGFMYAGADRVVASLWNVDDEATAEFMAHFYEGILRKGQTPAQALRSAQNWTRAQKRWQSPYYWAGFVLQGEWR